MLSSSSHSSSKSSSNSSTDSVLLNHLDDGVIAIGEILFLDIPSEYPVTVVVDRGDVIIPDVIDDNAVEGAVLAAVVELVTTLAGANFFSILNYKVWLELCHDDVIEKPTLFSSFNISVSNDGPTLIFRSFGGASGFPLKRVSTSDSATAPAFEKPNISPRTDFSTTALFVSFCLILGSKFDI